MEANDKGLESPLLDPVAIATGGAVGGARGLFARRAVTATATRREISSGAVQAMERQLARDGPGSVQRTIRSLTRRIAEHERKIAKVAREGGDTSSMEREVRAWRETVNAAEKLLEGSK